VCYDNTNHRVVEGEGCIGKAIGGNKESIVEPNIEKKVRATLEKHGEKVLKFISHNESLIKDKQQSKMFFFELKKKNSMLDGNLTHRELSRMETK
jgi:hypothetical protein